MESRKVEELFQKIAKKAMNDSSFKEKLINQPVPTIENFTGEQLKLTERKILVLTNPADNSTIEIEIPATPSIEDMELNEEQLDFISGGGDPGAIIQE
ncbi:TOMM propeptide domain-containing protein [Aquimarina brevivitae]|uniref:Uncharacterized protein n=1 Tax=Aquimarina brevivitae TaxID=323412 RepID=A0A4Q7PKF8_9FLAO|nr:TOMM propeptide domain-containing protein [Aquimarina brevivitae]RZS99442.1 hypothetical protein EV197_0652 [Aquimarina brevivitae]